MARITPIMESFNAGELSPLLEGRVDFAKYKKGLKLCENFIPLVQGPLTRRPGTKFAAEVKDSSKKTLLVEFEFSTTQAYCLEFGDQYVRFHRNHAQVTQTSQNITGITAANPGVVTYSGTDTYANGDRVVITGVAGMVQVNNREFTVANVNAGANTFELSGVNTSGYSAYTSGGTVAEIYEISTPYLEADLFDIQFAQSADVLYIAHPDYESRKLSRTGETSWTLVPIAFQDGPFLPTNSETTTLALSGTSGSVTVTASAVTGINGGSGFAATDVGRLIRWKDPASNWTWLEITAFTSTTVVTATIQGANASAGTATANWRLGVWSATTGYPGAVTFHGDRLFWGGATNYPQRIDGSNVGDYENHKPSNAAGTIADDNAVAFTLNANEVNVIRWMMSDEKGLIAGTVGGEWIIRASSQNEALTPSNVQATQSTNYGCASLPPLRAGKAIIFAQRTGRKLRELAYVFEDDGMRAPDMTVAAEHITRSGIADMAYQSQPQSIVWMARNDGVLLGFTYEREQEVLAWHRHTLGGVYGNGDAVVESVACIPNPAGTADELWVAVKRTVDGVTRRYIEYMDAMWDDSRDQEDAFYVDCGLTYDGSAVATITGLWHLNGQTVTILADGAAHPDKTVANGAITLNRSASVVQIGLGYTSAAWTQRAEAASSSGTAQGKLKRINKITVRLWQALGDWKFGTEPTGTLEKIIFRSFGDAAGVAPPLFEGDKDVTLPGGYESEGRIYWQVTQPFPGTLLALMPEVET
jgi:hypothetical protein